MNIEESIEVLKNMILMPDGWIIGKDYKGNLEFIGCLEGQEAIETLLTAYEKNKGLEEKIKKYINIIQKKLDKYKIKNTNTYLQIEGNPGISELLIQKATLEELIKEE